jgi:hypothetical protein
MTQDRTELQPWEGVYPLPNVRIPRCPWCRRESDVFLIVLFELPTTTGGIQSSVACERCAQAGLEYIRSRKRGLTHKQTLRDFGFRE